VSDQPPRLEAPVEEWASWLRRIGRPTLDPERVRAEARRQVEQMPLGGGYQPPAAELAEEARPMLVVNVSALSPRERAALSMYLEETAQRALAGTTSERHPVVRAVRALAVAIDAPGVPDTSRIRLDQDRREQLYHLMRAAFQRAEAERRPEEVGVRQVAAAVELWAFGPDGYQPPAQPRRPEPEGMWTTSEPFRAL